MAGPTPLSDLEFDDQDESRNREWWLEISEEKASKAHDRNVDRITSAIEYHNQSDRPLEILAIHGSGRHPTLSCSHEFSNSAILLKTGLEAVDDGDININEIYLREINIEHCNNCLGSASANCGWPCNCYPLDGMQLVYEKVLRADVLLMSTGVNQSMISSRLKSFCDRLISADGGIFVDKGQFQMKDEHWKRKMMALSASGEFAYVPRLAGRVCAYFVTSKDLKNDMIERPDVPNYDELILPSLKSSFYDYGCVHADPWFVIAGADHTVDYQFDKENYNNQADVHEESRSVVLAAIERARDVRANGHEMPVDRVNRT